MTVLDRILAPMAQLMEPPRGLEFDYAQPAGEPALFSPNSVSWQVFKNPVALFVGGVTAVILELAEPSVRTGVWDHSTFRTDAVMRLRRTGAAAMMTVYGPRRAAETMIARVVKAHDTVQGTTPDGVAYHANDPRLLDWVQATATYGFIEAYSRFARHLTDEDKSRAFAEAQPAARLYGAMNTPRSAQDWRMMLAEFEPSLEPSPIIFEFLDIMRSAPIAPAGSPLQRMLVGAAIELVPSEIRSKLHLGDHRVGRVKLAAVSGMARIADRLPLRDAPPAQASVRVGKSPTFLYRGHASS